MIERSSLPLRAYLGRFTVIALLSVAAAGVGILSSVSPALAIAAIGALVAVPAALFRPRLVVQLLLVSVLLETARIGGVTIGRLVAPLAALAVVASLIGGASGLRRRKGLLVAVAGYAVVALASIQWSLAPNATVVRFGSLAIALATMMGFAVLVRTEDDLRALLWTVTVASGGLGAIYVALFLSGVDPSARVGHTLFPAQCFEKVH